MKHHTPRASLIHLGVWLSRSCLLVLSTSGIAVTSSGQASGRIERAQALRYVRQQFDREGQALRDGGCGIERRAFCPEIGNG
jgi:hypothetical protein